MKEFLKAVNKLATECVVKVLKIDLNTGYYSVVHLDKGEASSNSSVFDDMIKESIEKNLIHPDYVEMVEHILNTEHIKKTLKYKKYIHLKFKRASNKNADYRMNVTTLLPIENNRAYIVFYDIED